MAVRASKRSSLSSEESSLAESTSTREEEKTIPFLRRLSDMLLENDDVISFYPGNQSNGKVVLGRIVVHDRHKVESDILPRYFNHASFASLRRQLNYFNFVRMGKGRQRGATYCNEAVIELSDILRLKRKSASHSTTGSHPNRCTHHSFGDNVGEKSNYTSTSALQIFDVTPSLDDCSLKKTKLKKRKICADDVHLQNALPHAVSDDDSPVVGLIVSSDPHNAGSLHRLASFPVILAREGQSAGHHAADLRGDEDVLAGCSVLLSFCNAKFGSV